MVVQGFLGVPESFVAWRGRFIFGRAPESARKARHSLRDRPTVVDQSMPNPCYVPPCSLRSRTRAAA